MLIFFNILKYTQSAIIGLKRLSFKDAMRFGI